MSTVYDALKQTDKGKLKYDCNWKEEGRTEEIVNSVKQNLITLNVIPLAKIQQSLKTVNHNDNDKNLESKESINNDCDKIIGGISNANNSDNNANLELNYASIDLELKNYEKQKNIEISERSQRLQREWHEKNESLMKNHEDQMRMIQKKYLLESIKFQKKYENEIKQLELELMNENNCFDTIENNPDKRKSKYNQKLLEIKEKQTLLLKEKERVREQNEQIKMKILEIKNNMNQKMKTFDKYLQELPNYADDDQLIHECNQAKLLEQDIEVVLISKNEYDLNDQKLCEEKLLEFYRINENFLKRINELIQKQKQQIEIERYTINESINDLAKKPVDYNNNNGDNRKTNVDNNNLENVAVQFESAHNQYIEYQSKLLKFEQLCEKFVKNEMKKTLRTSIQIYVRSIVNTICNISDQHLREKIKKLLNLFQTKTFECKGKKLQLHEQDYSYHFAIDTTVRIILTVASKQQNISLKLAPVVIILWSNISMFGDIFLAHLYLHCPYCIPYFPRKNSTNKQSDIDFLIICGYQLDKNGQLETEETFQSRIYSLIELYSSIIQCDMLIDEHPINIQNAWKWLAMILNDQPKSELTALLLDAFLSISAHKLLKIYRKQFIKLFNFIINDYLVKIESITPKQSRQTLMKLKSLLEQYHEKLKHFNNNNIDYICKQLQPNGLVSNYFFSKSYIFS